MELLEIMQNRRSIRQYTGAPIPEDAMTKIVQSGLLSPSSCNRRPWELIVVKNKETLEKMAAAAPAQPTCSPAQRQPLSFWAMRPSQTYGQRTAPSSWQACISWPAAWASAAAGSQGRNREAADGSSSEEYLRELLPFSPASPSGSHPLSRHAGSPLRRPTAWKN